MSALEKKVEKLKAGDAAAFEFIYEKTHRALYFAVLYILKEKAAAEDIVQDTYLRAYNNLDKFGGGNFTGWLVKMGRNLALNYLEKRRREVPLEYAPPLPPQENDLFIYDLAAKILNEDEYRIVMLCQVAGYKRREVAAMMELPIGTVTWRNNEALKKLKAELIKGGYKR